jgi:hypothetical protein
MEHSIEPFLPYTKKIMRWLVAQHVPARCIVFVVFQAQKFIDSARDLLDNELTAMASESYQRAYGAMVMVQMLSELEEVMQYRLVPERRPTLKAMWWQRLQSGQRLVEDWQRIIQVHSLVLTPQEDKRTWVKYASLCRKSGSLVSIADLSGFKLTDC